MKDCGIYSRILIMEKEYVSWKRIEIIQYKQRRHTEKNTNRTSETCETIAKIQYSCHMSLGTKEDKEKALKKGINRNNI